MKRLHVHVAVDNLADSIRFYSGLFATEPTVIKSDYAKWMLDDPRVNFAISRRGAETGLNHLGIQVESDTELKHMQSRLESLQPDVQLEANTACCYAKSDKYWITDPQGIAWETFHTLDVIPVFGEEDAGKATDDACCVPTPAAKPAATSCCVPSSDQAKAKCC